jgi:hypothetical protein
MEPRAVTSFAMTGDPGLIEEVARAVAETLARFDLPERPDLAVGDAAHWEQSGGWYQVVQPDPWSQSGGWVLDLEGRISTRLERPEELVVRDVFAALERARLKPDPTWEQAWGPLPQPEPGPGPGL